MKRPTFVLYSIWDHGRHCGAFIHKACIPPLQYRHSLTDSYLFAWFYSSLKLCFLSNRKKGAARTKTKLSIEDGDKDDHTRKSKRKEISRK